MNITDYLRTALINHAFGVAKYTPPATIYAGLFTALPANSASAGVEVTATDYVRIPTTWAVATLGQTSNATLLTFPASGTTQNNWGTVVGAGLFDTPTGGHLLFYGAQSVPTILASGTGFEFSVGNLVVSLS